MIENKESNDRKPLPGNKQYLLWGLLSLTQRAIIKARDRELMKCGISTEQSAILNITMALDHKPTPTELSKYLIRERHSVSETVNKMIKVGLLKRTRDSKRKNMFRLSLTDKGLQAYQCSRNRESIYWIMSALSEEEGLQLESSLNELLNRALIRLGINDRIPLPSSMAENNM